MDEVGYANSELFDSTILIIFLILFKVAFFLTPPAITIKSLKFKLFEYAAT